MSISLFNNHKASFLLVSLILLYLSFGHNIFHAVNPEKFYTTGHVSDALVIARMVETRDHGLQSMQSRMGRYLGEKGNFDLQRDANQKRLYLGQPVDEPLTYTPYDSQFGAQALFFSYLDDAMAMLDIAPQTRLTLFHSFLALVFSIIIIALLSILYDDIGPVACGLILISILFSRWQVYYAKSLYWMLPTMFLPMLTVFIACKRESLGGNFYLILTSIIVMLIIMLDALMGYEYISTIMLAAVTPLVYFMLRDNWNYRQTAQRFITIGTFSLIGFLLAFLIHTLQLKLAYGSLSDAIDIIKERILVRTYTNPEDYANTAYYESQTTSVFYVLYVYLLKGGTFRLKVPFLLWILMLIHITIRWMRNDIVGNPQKIHLIKTLVITTWFSLLAPLSWLVLAKSHSEIHIQVNYIVWCLPFTFFAFALYGVYWEDRIRNAVNTLINRFRPNTA
ncbi:MAG: hypothetical protein OEZ38_13360 [Gammaproteobacteria bacterium]|nr:hypothetical protein [Gammaproteobacteria bacterium]